MKTSSFTRSNNSWIISSVIALTLCSGCSTSEKSQKKPLPEFSTAKRQVAPDPVYNRLRWVHLPEVLPTRETISRGSSASLNDNAMIFKIIHFDLTNGTLAEASQMLAASSSYRSYCDPSIADKKITLSALGTIHELANKISEQTGIEVIVDHTAREVRFMPRGAEGSEERIRFYDNTVNTYEHR